MAAVYKMYKLTVLLEHWRTRCSHKQLYRPYGVKSILAICLKNPYIYTFLHNFSPLISSFGAHLPCSSLTLTLTLNNCLA